MLEIVVVASTKTELIKDIGVLVELGKICRITCERANASKDLWTMISRRELLKLSTEAGVLPPTAETSVAAASVQAVSAPGITEQQFQRLVASIDANTGAVHALLAFMQNREAVHVQGPQYIVVPPQAAVVPASTPASTSPAPISPVSAPQARTPAPLREREVTTFISSSPIQTQDAGEVRLIAETSEELGSSSVKEARSKLRELRQKNEE